MRRQLMTRYLYDRPKFINIYGPCCCAAPFSLHLSLFLTVVVAVADLLQAPTHLLILKFRAGVVSFLTPRSQMLSPVRSPQPCHRTLLPLSRTHVLYFLRAYHITYTYTQSTPFIHFARDFSAVARQANRITYTNYHHHCALKNIFLLISLRATKVMPR